MATKKPAAKKTPATRANKGVRVPGSMADQINSLDVGQSVAVAQRFDIQDHGHGGGMIEAMKTLRSNMGAYVGRITEEMDMREFKIESGEFVTSDKSGILAVVTVTRVD